MLFLGALSPTSNHTRDSLDVVAYLIDECGFHPGDLVDAKGERLPLDALGAMALVCHLELEHEFGWEDLESDSADLPLADLVNIHATLAPKCDWPP
jgi:hypothetical protein